MLLGAALQMFCHKPSLLKLHKTFSVFSLLSVFAVCCFSIQLNQVFLYLCHHTVQVCFPSELLLARVSFSLHIGHATGNMSISTAVPPAAVFIITGAGRPSSFCRQAQVNCKYIFKNTGTCQNTGAVGVKYHTKYLSALSVSKHFLNGLFLWFTKMQPYLLRCTHHTLVVAFF